MYIGSNKNGIESSKRVTDLLNGLALLYFNTCKGVKGCLHSKGGVKISVVFDLLLPLTGEVLYMDVYIYICMKHIFTHIFIVCMIYVYIHVYRYVIYLCIYL
jgi:hypothetical protein